MSPDTSARRPRADGQRNYQRLVTAARAVFEEQGPDASLDRIAQRAGVANATLYRHFPARSDLLVAVFADEVQALLRLGEELAQAPEAGDGLRRWLRQYVEHVASKQDLSKAFPGPGDGREAGLAESWRASVQNAAAVLLARAQRAGAVRADLDVTDLLTMVTGIAVTAASDRQRERLLTLFLDGLLPRR